MKNIINPTSKRNKTTKKELSKKQWKEAEIRAKEIRRQFEELNKKQKAFEEIERRIFSRIPYDSISTIRQASKQYEGLLKETSEQLKPIRNTLEKTAALQSASDYIKNYLTPSLQHLASPLKQLEEQVKKINEINYLNAPDISIVPPISQAEQNAKIVSELRNLNNKIEGLITQKSFPVKITEIPELEVKKSEDKKKLLKKTTLYLNQNGDLYREPKNRYCYPMGEKSNRYKIIAFLAQNKGYQATRSIAEVVGTTTKTTQTEIGKIRKNIRGFLKIKDEEIIESKRGSGYRINPKYKIHLKNK